MLIPLSRAMFNSRPSPPWITRHNPSLLRTCSTALAQERNHFSDPTVAAKSSIGLQTKTPASVFWYLSLVARALSTARGSAHGAEMMWNLFGNNSGDGISQMILPRQRCSDSVAAIVSAFPDGCGAATIAAALAGATSATTMISGGAAAA
eukprot:CAMPEP_0115313696 /NCGR_PEP_ID=MMETSP0270-20121206/76617_1 /TAXON_ID=71861 /ORGANISM="Scrippsiella trochoidea, Strain CCMP3099" /LENGTH=149 /DNA_ID=CAMNT_0002732833 /DNA_START=205 /DNA_END=651 /DNA_ORIENTATION=-